MLNPLTPLLFLKSFKKFSAKFKNLFLFLNEDRALPVMIQIVVMALFERISYSLSKIPKTIWLKIKC